MCVLDMIGAPVHSNFNQTSDDRGSAAYTIHRVTIFRTKLEKSRTQQTLHVHVREAGRRKEKIKTRKLTKGISGVLDAFDVYNVRGRGACLNASHIFISISPSF